MDVVKAQHEVLSCGTANPVRHFLSACGAFALNVVGRFHEYADARLAEELTIVEQRRRLLDDDRVQGGQQPHTHRPVHVD